MNTPEKIAEDEWIETSRGVDAINFQRNAHMTWISVLMAMVVVVLAEKTSATIRRRRQWVWD
jgi:ABC-type phosphate/phosphonate transport system permease subunit